MAGRSVVDTPAENLEYRLSEAAAAVEAYYGPYIDELEVRDLIVIEAVQAGLSNGRIARAAGISAARVTQIIAARWPR